MTRALLSALLILAGCTYVVPTTVINRGSAECAKPLSEPFKAPQKPPSLWT